MSNLTCTCGAILNHIDEPCPECLPSMAWRPSTKICQECITLRKQIGELESVARAARLLRIAVAGYQNDHDHLGGDHIDTGRSWMVMTRARDNLATALGKET